MKKLLIVLAILSLPVAVLAGHMATEAAQVDHFRREEATAAFSSTAGCIRTDVDVFAITGHDQHASNATNSLNDGHVTLNQFDTCKGREVLHAEGHTALGPSDFKTDRNLKSATLNTTVPLIEEDTGEKFDVTIHVTWNGNGGVKHDTARARVPRSLNTILTNIQGRTGAATGSVIRDGTNLTPEPSTFARLGNVLDNATSGT
ncbi:hypothetical protein [Nitrolancea hollandica]|nr:hypothetical protein [Nitrolancea hollandica]